MRPNQSATDPFDRNNTEYVGTQYYRGPAPGCSVGGHKRSLVAPYSLRGLRVPWRLSFPLSGDTVSATMVSTCLLVSSFVHSVSHSTRVYSWMFGSLLDQNPFQQGAAVGWLASSLLLSFSVPTSLIFFDHTVVPIANLHDHIGRIIN